MTEWIRMQDKPPPTGVDVLVLKTFLDAEYGEHGYHPDKSFWTRPTIQVDCFYSDNHWHAGSKATHWMPLPRLPDEVD